MKQFLLFSSLLAMSYTAAAQHDHHHPPAKKDSVTAPAKNSVPAVGKDSVPANKAGAVNHQEHIKKDTAMNHKQHHPADHSPVMNHAFSRNLPMTRNGSGTSWMPDSSPMYMYM